MVLNGSFQVGDMKMPVRLIVDQAVDMSAKWAQGVNINNGTVYNTYLVLSLPVLSAGITANMLNAASNVNGLITISAVSNTAIYQKIVANMQRAMTAQFGTATAQGNGSITDPGNATMQTVSGNGSDVKPGAIVIGK
jgi:hypothetical protein